MSTDSYKKTLVYGLFLFLILQNVEVVGYSNQRLDSMHGIQYRCPPCGCTRDSEIFSSSGSCPNCRMKLVEVPVGLGVKIDREIASSLAIGGLGKIYTKLIYPVFAFGILLSVFFLFRSIKAKSSNVFLLGLVLTMSLYGFKNQLFAASYSLFNTHNVLFLPISYILLIGPLIYFYTKSLILSPFQWKKKYWIHFMPGILMCSYYTTLMLLPEQLSWQFMFSPYEVRFSHAEQTVSVFSGFIYLLYSHKFIHNWKTTHAHVNKKISNWIFRFLLGMTFLFLVWGALIFINFWLYDFGVTTLSYNPLWVVLALVIVWFLLEIFTKPSLLAMNLSSKKPLSNRSLINENTKYLKSGLKKEESEKLLSRFREYLNTSEAFLDPTINLDSVSSELKEYKHHISQAINSTAGMNFYSFINEFRLERANEKLKDYRSDNKTIEAISFECGFSSKSTFNSLYKQKYGVTPSQFFKNGSMGASEADKT